MIKTDYTKTGNTTVRVISSDSIDEVIESVVPTIREQSQNFYKRELQSDLEQAGESIIDHHAIGVRTKVYLSK